MKTKMQKIVVLMLSMLLPSLIIVSYEIFSDVPADNNTSAKTNIKNVRMYYLGNNQVLDSVLDRSRFAGAQATPLGIQELDRIAADLTASSVVLMDGAWISQQVSNTVVHAFLRQAVSQGAKLAAMGGSTAAFLEALDQAKIDELPRNETTGILINPAYDNPPIVGFKLMQATTPYGEQYSYPSIFSCGNTQDIDAVFGYFSSWVGG
jgi:hypothetical protein